MTISYNLAPIPKWVVMNTVGKAAGGALLYTYSSLNHVQEKAVYQDAGAVNAYTNPIQFDLNGTQGPFYWQYNTATPDDLYFLYCTDANGNELFTIEDYNPSQGGGGGSIVNNFISLDNMIANPGLINNIGSAVTTSVTNLVLAPSNHVGFTPADVNPISTTNGGVVGPDIRFLKSNTTGTDAITFSKFSLSDGPLTSDTTPQFYCQYQCTVAGTGETYKTIQFPICQGVKNLANSIVTFQIWMKTVSGTETATVSTRQYYGAGATGTPELITSQGSLALTTTWTQFSIELTVPSTAGVSLGATPTGDDALYMLLNLPLDKTTNILWTKPKMVLGEIDPSNTFETYDHTDSITNSARTGDLKSAYKISPTAGWLALNDTTIGNASSGASTSAEYTFQLFKTLWDNVSDTYAPVSTGRGATAQADWIAGKTITLPSILGRALGSAGAGSGLTSRALGQTVGEETHTMTTAELVQHAHTYIVPAASGVAPLGSPAGGQHTSLGNTSDGPGSATPFNVMQPTSFVNMFIKL